MRKKSIFTTIITALMVFCFVGCYETDVKDADVGITKVVESGEVEVADDAESEEVKPEDEGLEEGKSENEDVDVEYIGNRKSLKFHYPWCHSAKAIKESNQVYFYGSRDDVVEKGYNPCWNCGP